MASSGAIESYNFSCDKCPRTFKLEEFYEKHKKVHDLKKQHVCELCGFVYGAAKGLEGHLKAHAAEEIKPQSPPLDNLPKILLQGSGNYEIYDSIPEITDASSAKINESGFFVCIICSREFSGLNSLKKHVPIHTRKVQHKCDICGFVFGKKEYLSDHARKHTGESSPACDVCSQTFNKNLKLKEHYKLHRNISMDGSLNESVPFRCHLCQDVYVESRFLKDHLLSVHQENLHRCDICPATFGDVRGKNHHMYNEHKYDAFGQKSVWCPICSQGFTRHYNLKIHMLKSHGRDLPDHLQTNWPEMSPTKTNNNNKSRHYFDKTKGTQMLTCSMCPDKFLRRSDLLIHLEGSHAIHLTACALCNDKFQDASELKEHVFQHHARKPGPASRTNAPASVRFNAFECGDCGMFCSSRSALSVHMTNVHGAIGDVVCDICRKSYVDLESHQKTKHFQLNKRLKNLKESLGLENGGGSSSPPKKMKLEGNNYCPSFKSCACPVCGVVLSPKTNINVHLRTHSGDRPYTCVLCLNKFRQKAHLMKHFRCSHNQKKPPFVCQFCGDGSFGSSNDLYRHITDIHKDETAALHPDEPEFESPEEYEEKIETTIREEEEEEDVRYEPITEEFYFEDMVISPCYVVIPYVTEAEIEAACSVTQDMFDDLEEEQGRLTIDESVADDEIVPDMSPVKMESTPFIGERTPDKSAYDAEDIKVGNPIMGFYPNLADFSLPFSLCSLWKKKADVLGPAATLKEADLLQKQIKNMAEFNKFMSSDAIKEEEAEEFEKSGLNLEMNGDFPTLESSVDSKKKLPPLSPSFSPPKSGSKSKASSPQKVLDATVTNYESQVQNDAWPVECIKCSVHITSLENFNLHMNDHWTSNKCCPVCGLLINSKRFNFKQHLKIHTGEKPFVCNICSRSFRQKAHMVKHVTTHRTMPNMSTVPQSLAVN